MAKRTLFVHIGAHRTATSTIQTFLEKNIDRMLARGFFLPFGSGRHVRLVNQLFSGECLPDEVAQDLNRRADAKPGPVHAIVVSDEDIMTRERLTPFAALQKHFDVKIVVALRRQDLWLESWYLQNIKWQWNPELAHLTLPDFMAKRESFHWIDYDRYLTALAADFGADNILPFVFEAGQMPAGPVETFARLVGLDTGGFTPAPHRNASLSPLMAEFLRRVPIGAAGLRLRAQLERAFVEADAALAKTPQEASALLLAPDERRAVMDRYAAGNRRVAQRYFGRDALFHDPLPDETALLGRLALPEDSEELMQRLVEPVMRDLVGRLDTFVAASVKDRE